MADKQKLIPVRPHILVIFLFLTWGYCSFPQESSIGTIDFSFKPQNGITQFVIWVEDEEGEYIKTIYITDFIGRNGGGNRTSDPNIDSPTGNRLSALPIWAHKRNVIDNTYGIDSYYPPPENQPFYPDDIDAVSGATPGVSTQTKTWQFSDLLYGEYNCWIEVNKSFDFNDYYEYSFYRGQPSVVWNMTINVADSANSKMIFDYIGYGSPDGSDGEINPPDSTITTANDLLSDLGGYKFKAFYTPASVGVKDNFSKSLPVGFFQSKNYPNPFYNSTSIRYHLPVSGFLILSIYDITGQEIETLVDEYQQAGVHQITWTAEGLPEGIYFYKLQSGDYTETKKLILNK